MLRPLVLMLTGVTLLMFLNQAEAKEAFIEMPSPCYSVETIKNEKVYLKEDEKACEQVVPKALIQIDDNIQKVEVYVKGKLWNVQELNKQDIDLEKIATAAKEQKIDVAMIENKNEEAAKRADEAAKQFYSEKYQNKLDKEIERIRTETFKMGDKENEAMYSDANNKPKYSLAGNSYIYIFVSASMPEDAIRAYVKDTALLKEHNIFIAFRGMLGNPPKIKETSKYIKKILQKDAECQGKCKRYKVRFAVDPILFENYKVTEVPTFVYDRQVQNREVGRKKEIKEESDYYKLKGDVSLEYALEIFRRETKEKELEILLDKIKPEYGTAN
ncbi:MAG: type-F conjugative transfer system pilin assembly protein TrbC [Smithella sp.]